MPKPGTRRAILLSLLLILTAALVLWRISLAWQSPLLGMAGYVLANGKIGPIAKEGIDYVGIPAESLQFHYITVESESGKQKSFQVRRRNDGGHIDIFLVDIAPGETAAHFFLTSTDGRLVKAAYLNPLPQPVDDAHQRFSEQIAFWKMWHSEWMKNVTN